MGEMVAESINYPSCHLQRRGWRIEAILEMIQVEKTTVPETCRKQVQPLCVVVEGGLASSWDTEP